LPGYGSFASGGFVAGRACAYQSPHSLTPLTARRSRKQKQLLASTEIEEAPGRHNAMGALRRTGSIEMAVFALTDPIQMVRASAAYALLSLPE